MSATRNGPSQPLSALTLSAGALEPDQERLLLEMAGAARDVPRGEQRWHLSERDQDDSGVGDPR